MRPDGAGPATWIAGDVPEGRADDPVGGVSWYEAAAYCAFRGEQLPTVYHWARAALPPREMTAPLGPSIVPLSNFAGQGPAPVGEVRRAWGRMARTTWPAISASGPGTRRRSRVGSSSAARWNDPDYMFSVPFSLPPGDRSPANGFRCMRPPEPGGSREIEAAAQLFEPVNISTSDYRSAQAGV